MLGAFDQQRLYHWLRKRAASRSLLAWVVDPSPDGRLLGDEECALLLEALLVAAIDPLVRAERVDGLIRVARALGYDDGGLDQFVRDTLRITTRRLRAYGVLQLPLGATAEDVKAAHRRIVKEVHPDRYAGADPATVERAAREVMALNHARALLNQPYQDVILEGEDDVYLEPDDTTRPLEPFEWVQAPPAPSGQRSRSSSDPFVPSEDADTELYDDLSWSELIG
jgi:DnaJ-domain-containing protein 1